MLIIFSIVNFALTLLAIFFIILLFIKFSKVQQLEQDYRRLIQEAEDTISSYVMELKEENSAFLKRLNENTRQKNSEVMDRFDERESELSAIDVKELLAQENVQEAVEEPTIQQNAFEEWSLKDQVKYLIDEGLTSEEIAKKLNKGKTEIELLLKFRQ
ncbi:hypothetical protein AB685_12360 [Bacillus sp. LL01]|uniref:hypothetical protein n=1 Tax=Bacillus sp. LL01 TaxID=1665556 RepID=UPI00064D5EEC|nr:hypothetical protein [Bacillus sp. LL01]KMJ58662.1 hypothetical protein AB685_12360 [Bacillus sp. LL01]